jgi:hypothetical protein
MEARGGLYFPIKLRCADPSDLFGRPELGAAVARALGRAFTKARTSLPPGLAQGDWIELQPPELVRGDLNGDRETALLTLLREAIELAARAQRLNGGIGKLGGAPAVSTEEPSPDVGQASGVPPSLTEELSEPFDPSRFDPYSATYEIPSYKGGKAKVPASSTGGPFSKLLRLFDVNIQQLSDLLSEQQQLEIANGNRVVQWIAMRIALEDLQAERLATSQLAAVYVKQMKPADVKGREREIADRVVQNYYTPDVDFPDPQLVANRVSQLQRGGVLLNIVRARVKQWDTEAAKHTDDAEEATRNAFLDVGTYYLELLTTLQHESFERLAFLDSYYSDPQIILVFAVIRYVRAQLPALWENMRLLSNVVLGDLNRTNQAPDVYRPVAIAIDRAIRLDRTVNATEGASDYGDLPRTQSGLRTYPDRKLAVNLSAEILRLQLEVPIVRLMDFRKRLGDAMMREVYIGVSLVSGKKDRMHWFQELDDLQKELENEWDSKAHPDFEKKVAKWEQTIDRLHGLIYKEIRNIQIRRAIGEQLPFLFLGVGVAAGVAAWVARIASGARWLVILAEAATLTVINVAGGIAATGKLPTAGAVATQFTTNLVLAGLGQVFRVLGAGVEAAQGLSAIRRVLVVTSLKASAFVSSAVLQTAIQSIEAEAQNKGGESSFTEMLTLNLLMNGLGLLFGAAMRVGPPGTTRKGTTVATPKEISDEWTANGVPIDEKTAKDWIDLANRTEEYQARYERLAKLAKAGKLSEGEFEDLRKEALAIIDELSKKLPPLAKLLGADMTPEQLQDMIKAVRTRVAGAQYSRPVLLLPQYTKGLTHVGDGPTFTYEPSAALKPATATAKGLAALREWYSKQGMGIRDLVGGGYEVSDPQGKIVFQALPLPAAARGGLTVTLEEVARGPKATEGLDRVRTQTAAPELPAQFAQAAQRNRRAVTRILQVLARGDTGKSDDVWIGISKYFKGGGSPRTLARAITLAGDKDGGYAEALFEQMSSWGTEEVQGLEQVYEIRPRTTGEEIGTLLNDFTADEVKSILRDINTVAPVSRASGLRRVIGQLTVEFQPPQRYRQGQVAVSTSQRGARGVLASAVELLRRFPGKSVDFEVPGLTPEGAKRIEDLVIVDPKTGERILGFEIKEVTSAFLGKRAPKQLAADIARDADVRRRVADFGGAPRKPFDTFRWRIRRYEIETQAIKRLADGGVTQPTPKQIDAEMRSMVRESLKDAFEQPEVKALPPGIRADYREAFDAGLSFVEFF